MYCRGGRVYRRGALCVPEGRGWGWRLGREPGMKARRREREREGEGGRAGCLRVEEGQQQLVREVGGAAGGGLCRCARGERRWEPAQAVLLYIIAYYSIWNSSKYSIVK